MTTIIYVGGLVGDIRESEVEDLFYKYGKIKRISIKPGVAGGMPAFCFVEYGHPDDAYDAVKAMDGREAHGKRLRVELSRGRGNVDERYGGRDDRGRGGGGGGGGGFNKPYNTDFRVVVQGLPPTASWQDLKDHMRRGGEVTFAQVVREGGGAIGLVDYATEDDMRSAIRKLDDTEFKNPYDKSYIRVREDTGRDRRGDRGDRGGDRGDRDRGDRGRGRSRERSAERGGRGRDDRRDDRDRGRSPRGRSGSPVRDRSPRDRSASPARERSASPARDRSASPAREARRSRSASEDRGRSRSPRDRSRSRS